jgi:type II secretory pathway component PulM
MRRPPRRPPEKKLMLAAVVLLVMACAFASRAEPGFAHKEVVTLRGF